MLQALWISIERVLNPFVAGLPAALMLAAVATIVEFIVPVERHTLKSRLAPFIYGFTGLMIGSTCVILMSSVARALGVRNLISLPLSGFGVVGDALALCVSLLFVDLIAYWNHRLQHRVFWKIHAVHHSPTQLNAVSGYAHFGEKVFQYLLIGLPLTVVHFAFPPTPFVIVATVEMLERYIHMPIDAGLGPIGKVLVDNRFHRIHHSVEKRHFDKNFGIMFSFWDRLFGTAYEPGEEWPAVGITNNPPPMSVWQFLIYPLHYRTDATPVDKDALGDGIRTPDPAFDAVPITLR